MVSSFMDPNVVQLISGVKPFLNSNGQVVTESLLNMAHLISSDHAQNTIQTMGRFIAGKDSDKKITIKTAAGNVTFSLQIAFTLFLILILLILAVLSFNFDWFGDNPLEPIDIAMNEVDENDESQGT